MRRNVLSALVMLGAVMLLGPGLLSAQNTQREKRGVDLGIARGLDSHRPNILVASEHPREFSKWKSLCGTWEIS